MCFGTKVAGRGTRPARSCARDAPLAVSNGFPDLTGSVNHTHGPRCLCFPLSPSPSLSLSLSLSLFLSCGKVGRVPRLRAGRVPRLRAGRAPRCFKRVSEMDRDMIGQRLRCQGSSRMCFGTKVAGRGTYLSGEAHISLGRHISVWGGTLLSGRHISLGYQQVPGDIGISLLESHPTLGAP